jgi:hypothetical protein
VFFIPDAMPFILDGHAADDSPGSVTEGTTATTYANAV